MTTRPSVILVGPQEGIWLSFHGIPAQLLALGAQTSGTYALSRGHVPPGGGAPPHVHDFDEGFYLVSGEMIFTAGNRVISAGAGSFINIRGGTAHTTRNATNADADVVVIAAPAGFDDFQRAVGEPAPGPDGPFAPAPADIRQRMQQASAASGIDMQPAAALFEIEPEIIFRRAGEGERLAAVGDVYTFLATSEHTGDRYAIWHATIHPGGGPPPHVHTREEEAFFILRGELAAYDQGQRTVAKPGSLLILPRNSLHWFKNETEEPVEMLILIAPGGGEEMFRQFGRPWSSEARPPLPDREEIARLIAIAPDFGVELHLPGGH